MGFLADSELKELLESDNPPIKKLDLGRDLANIECQIQPCSVDLRIDEIYLPPKQGTFWKKPMLRATDYRLEVGESVKVATREEFDLSNDFGALLVAPARITRKGILIPDVGHVDPGFQGPVRLTLINMGRSAFHLRSGDTIISTLLFRMGKRARIGLKEKSGGEQPYARGLVDIDYLSSDFLAIQARAEKTAREVARKELGESGWQYAMIRVFLPILIGILAATAAYYFQVEPRLKTLEALANQRSESLSTSRQIRDLEKKIDDLSLFVKKPSTP